jgi:O-antigen/teichoic acid export membrane protein
MGQQRSMVVSGAIWLSAGAVGLAGLATLFTIVFKDELVDDWAADRTDVASVTPPAFVPVAVTMFFTVAMLTFVVLAFFRQGYEWARILLSLIALVLALATLAVLQPSPPTLFLVVAIVSLIVDVAAVLALWHKDSRVFCSEPVDLSQR